jgi:hypothetical protein
MLSVGTIWLGSGVREMKCGSASGFNLLLSDTTEYMTVPAARFRYLVEYNLGHSKPLLSAGGWGVYEIHQSISPGLVVTDISVKRRLCDVMLSCARIDCAQSGAITTPPKPLISNGHRLACGGRWAGTKAFILALCLFRLQGSDLTSLDGRR